jgi:hypothetical protein
MRACIFNLLLALAFLFFGNSALYAQVKILRVEPGETDPAIETVHSANLAVYDLGATTRHRLFFFIAGTGAKATNSLAMATVFAKWGYHALSLDYENNVITVALAHSQDPAAFGQYRENIVTGAPGSDKVKVDPANSILNRFKKLLTYLAAHDPTGGWDEFVTNGEPIWSRIIVAGHSQGSGHAAYIGKMFEVDRVLIFSGPQDYLSDLGKPAPWQSGPSATPPSHFFAFLSQNDPFNIQHQLANCALLMDMPKPETLAVKPEDVIHGNYHIFINDFPAKSAHGSTMSTQFTNVWNYITTASDK